jgi:hypothetical protein
VKLRKPTNRNFDYFWRKFGVIAQTVVSGYFKKEKEHSIQENEMTELIDIQDIFDERFYFLDEETILELNKNDYSAGLNNVIVGLEIHCYGVFLDADNSDIEYSLFYVNGTKLLEGGLLKLKVNLHVRDELVLLFSHYLSYNYKEVDLVNSFNTFQGQTRSLLEKMNYLTISSTTLEKFEGHNPTFIAKDVKGIIPIQLLDKGDFYRKFFGGSELPIYYIESSYVYLMLNKRNGFIKIGKSKWPQFREKTLQADEPEIELITFWEAPATLEKQLHKRFAEQRQRGEWFELTFKDLKSIKDIMNEYETKNI